MNGLISKTPVHLTFPDDAWCDLKPELSQEDSDYVLSKMVTIIGKEASINVLLGKLPAMERYIVAWSFDVPITRENISNLQSKYRNMINAKIDELGKTEGFLPPKAST